MQKARTKSPTKPPTHDETVLELIGVDNPDVVAIATERNLDPSELDRDLRIAKFRRRYLDEIRAANEVATELNECHDRLRRLAPVNQPQGRDALGNEHVLPKQPERITPEPGEIERLTNRIGELEAIAGRRKHALQGLVRCVPSWYRGELDRIAREMPVARQRHEAALKRLRSTEETLDEAETQLTELLDRKESRPKARWDKPDKLPPELKAVAIQIRHLEAVEVPRLRQEVEEARARFAGFTKPFEKLCQRRNKLEGMKYDLWPMRD